MKSIFIVSSYPSTPKKLNILKECLISVKDMGFDVLLTTNYPITDPDIYKMIDYLIWDKTDIQNFNDYDLETTEGWFMKTNFYRASASFDNAYHFDLYRSLRSGVNLSNSLKYDFFYYLEGDNVILDKDFIVKLRDRMFEEKKRLLFVEMHMVDTKNDYMAYMTHIFGGIPEYFIKSTSSIPFEVDQWASNPLMYLNGMEVIFYEVIKDKNEILKLDIKELDEKVDFNKIKKCDTYGFNYMFFIDKSGEIYLNLFNSGSEMAHIQLKVNDEHWMNVDLGEGGFYVEKIAKINLLNKKITEITTVGEDVMIFEKIMNEKMFENLKKSQTIMFF